MDIVLFGMQGSGKGTQGAMLAQKTGWKVFETGGVLRALASQDSELAKKVKSIMEAGNLVPTEVVMEIIANFIETEGGDDPIIFDGIPRSMDQAIPFDELMKKEGRDFLGVLIDIDQETALKRLTTRRICEGCKAVYVATYDKDECEKCGGKLITRSDDNPEAIQQRLENYAAKTVPVIEKYESEDKMLRINGLPTPDEVEIELENKLKEKGLI